MAPTKRNSQGSVDFAYITTQRESLWGRYRPLVDELVTKYQQTESYLSEKYGLDWYCDFTLSSAKDQSPFDLRHHVNEGLKALESSEKVSAEQQVAREKGLSHASELRRRHKKYQNRLISTPVTPY